MIRTVGNDSLSAETGKFISEFKQIKSLADDCLLVFSSATDNETKAIRYGDFKKKFYDDAVKNLSIGSMAFKDRFRYSKVDHDHQGQCNKLQYISYYQEGEQDIKTVAKIYRSDNLQGYDCICGPAKSVTANEHLIGSLRFTCNVSQHFAGLSGINSPDFNGWIVPDGQKLPVNQITNPNFTWTEHPFFDGNDQTLAIPRIADFLKLSPEHQSEQLVPVPHVEQAFPHSHETRFISADVECHISPDNLSTEYCTTKSTTKFTDPICTYSKNVTSSVFNGQVELHDAIIPFKLSADVSEPVEIYPTHDKIPVLVYIGGRFLK